MADFSFNPVVDSVSLLFKCSHCGMEIQTDVLTVPTPDYTAENHRDSSNSEDYEYECENCGASFNISLCNGMYGGSGEISDLDEENFLKVTEEFLDENIDDDNP